VLLAAIFTVATLVTSSLPGCVEMMRSSFHLKERRLFSLMMTIMPSWMDIIDVARLVRSCNSETYSLFQRCQKYCCSFWTNCYLDNLESERCISVRSATDVNVRPNKK